MNTKFTKCNLICCNFSLCNLTNTVFDNCTFERVEFINSKIDGTTFNNCYSNGRLVTLNKTTCELETLKDPLVRELYDNVPEFSKMTDHSEDDLLYMVYGELSLKLFEDITTNTEQTDFTKKCFQFFNLLGDRDQESIDNLLVVGIYEGLYANKKCNDIAQNLLYGRNKEVYVHWMRHGNIRADY